MTLRRLALSLAASALAGGVALAGAPAIAQGTTKATVYSFSLPGSVTSGSDRISLPGDLAVKKSRGSRDLGKVTLADMVVTITKQAATTRQPWKTGVARLITRPGRARGRTP